MLPHWDNLLRELISRRENAEISRWITDQVKTYCPEVKIFSSLAENGESSLVLLKGSPKTLFVAHTDVVPAKPEDWKTDPYRLHHTQLKLFGRGVVDNKTHVALLLEELCHERHQQIAIALTTGEETRLWGANSVTLPSSITQVVVLEPTSNQLITTHYGTTGIEVVFISRGGHSSQRAASHPIVRAAAWISSLDCPADAILNVGRINGGDKLNVVPERCTVGVNFRSLSTPFSTWINQATAEHYIDDVIELFSFPPFHSSASKTLLEGFEKIGIPHSTEPAGFYSEAAIFEKRGYPTLLWGVGDIRHAHTVNEHIDKKDILRGKELLGKLISELG